MIHGFPDHLASARIRLRRLQRDDAEALCAYRSLPEVARYQSWDSFGPDDAARLIESQLSAEPDIPGTWFQLAIVEAATRDFIGDCGLHCPKDNPRQMEIGITVSSQHQGCGYATEAVECVLDYLFGSLNKHRVFASTDVLNRPAAALFRRLGFRQEAHFVESLWFKGQWGSEYLFALLKREWEERHSQTTPTPNRLLGGSVNEPVIKFSLLASEDLDAIRSLWEQLNQYHATLPTQFAAEIASRTFEARLRSFRHKAASVHLRVEVACTAAGAVPVAYCVTSLSSDGAGEVDSLYVTPTYRRMGIASALVQRALAWLRDSDAVSQRVVVLHANDAAVAFYGHFGFHPRNIEFELPHNPK